MESVRVLEEYDENIGGIQWTVECMRVLEEYK